MRIGIGFDIHRLVPERPLILGGVSIPWSKGLLGHSDADVLLHALCDALLGATGQGDMGTHFPDTDPQWANASSQIFLSKALELVKACRMSIANVDFVVLLEEPRLGSIRPMIQKRIAEVLHLEDRQVNLKAKTMEGLGSIGQGEAIAAYAVVLLKEAQ